MSIFLLPSSLFCLLSAIFLLTSCTQAPAPVTHYGIKDGPGSAGAHTVQPADTLYSISDRYKIPMRDIVSVNDLHPPFHLNVGQRLKLPPPREYRVRPGDTLYAVSRLFGVGMQELAQMNGLQEPYRIERGETLRLPQTIPQTIEVASAPTAQPARVAPVEKGKTIKPPATQSKPVKAKAKTKIPSRTPKRASSKFLKPVKGHVISSYGPQKGGLHNDGINLAAPRGSPVKAAENGVVVYVGNDLKGTGNLVLVRHADRWMSAYAHLGEMDVARGQTIARGDVIGKVGSTGAVDTPQLHFELRRGTKALNPKVYIEG